MYGINLPPMTMSLDIQANTGTEVNGGSVDGMVFGVFKYPSKRWFRYLGYGICSYISYLDKYCGNPSVGDSKNFCASTQTDRQIYYETTFRRP